MADAAVRRRGNGADGGGFADSVGGGEMTQLVRYDAARHALQEARSVDEIKDIKDKAEALRLYARQANDRDLEVWTAEIKVRAVRRIGELSAALETAPSGRAAVSLPAVGKSKSDALTEAGISSSSANRYEQVAAIPEAEFEAHIAERRDALEPASISGILNRAHVANNSGNNEWYTPEVFVIAARNVMGGIDTDPASSEIANRTVGAAVYYTEETNGLAHEWRGRVWMNPPYAQPLISEFCAKLVTEIDANRVEQACVLVNNATDTAWFHDLFSRCAAVCFVRGRIKFVDKQGNASGAPLQGQAIVYFGEMIEEFTNTFSTFGKVLCVNR